MVEDAKLRQILTAIHNVLW